MCQRFAEHTVKLNVVKIFRRAAMSVAVIAFVTVTDPFLEEGESVYCSLIAIYVPQVVTISLQIYYLRYR